tara:strand:- start:390 stop:596 length:207 start_codon:yes stop_codon:yes gene_type:complete
MDSKELGKKREDIQAKLKRMEDVHYKKPHWASESAYQDSVNEMRKQYELLFDVALELGDPVPVWLETN